MANTYSALHYHLIFSTKNRERYLKKEIEQRIWSYMAGIARHHKMIPIQIGGFDDHIHALLGVPPTLSVSQVAQYLKGESSKWMSETFSELSNFAWQEGYSAFAVSKSNLDAVIEYIKKQKEHHKYRNFQEEYRDFLLKHNVQYDENYLWG